LLYLSLLSSFSLVEALELIVADGDPVLEEGHEVARVKGHEEGEECEEEVAGGVVDQADQPAEEPCVLEEALYLHLNTNRD
jgi:hypothetical protein